MEDAIPLAAIYLDVNEEVLALGILEPEEEREIDWYAYLRDEDPSIVRESREVFRMTGPLICLLVIKGYHLGRLLRNFGHPQAELSQTPIFVVPHICHDQRYMVDMESFILQWDRCHDFQEAILMMISPR
ncbi:hypothetical protein AMTR_s00028p00151390 [Amborella trichopoda]|uniref:Uncharacterized protein n=1 Tax=Amborella trichopoda TaxID=13333 RepID=W1PRZ1_AMBTC|nr:hypothetical protein AMTR_s00028p00151390 [Amborella trichopoda]